VRRFRFASGYDAGNISKLGGADEWQRFFDLAAVSRREIPGEIMSDEELVKRLPLVFRTLRGQKVGDAQ